MKQLLKMVPVIILVFSGAAYGAEISASFERACNLQGREIALRISEEIISALSAVKRNEIADLAEQVCQEYALNVNELTVVERPTNVGAINAAVNTNEEGVAREANSSTSEQQDDSLLGDLRVIAPEDRVRRPGLKRR